MRHSAFSDMLRRQHSRKAGQRRVMVNRMVCYTKNMYILYMYIYIIQNKHGENSIIIHPKDSGKV